MRFLRQILMLAVIICVYPFAGMHASINKDTATGEKYNSYVYAGIGAGLDYGGIGVKVEFMPIDHIGIFGGLGYNFNDIGYNAGVSYKILPHKNITPVLSAMYGYNAVIKFRGYSSTTAETYFGFSAGAGLECRFGRRNTRFNFGLILPFRNENFRRDAKYASGMDKPLPVLLSAGFNFAL